MTGVLNMNGNKIKNVGTPYTYENDAAVNVGFFNTELNASNSSVFTQITNAYKQCVDEELLKSHLVSSHIENAFKYLLDQDESSSERNIIVNGIQDFNGSPHKNKKAYIIDLVYTPGTQNYDSKIGINLYSLPIGKYAIIMEYYFPEDINISLVAESSTAVINKQVTTSFSNHKKQLVQFDQRSKNTPDYLFFNIRGGATTSTNPEGYLVFYGVKEWVDSVPPEIYDHALETGMFEYDGGKMKMNMDLDLNGNSINAPFFITGHYKKSKSSNRIFLNDVSAYQIIPFDCVLKEIVCHFYTLNNNDYQITLHVRSSGKSHNNQTLNSSLNARRQVFSGGINLSKIDVLWIDIHKKNTDEVITHDEAGFAFSFTPR